MCSAPALTSASRQTVREGVEKMVSSPATFFEEKYFWNKANLGPFFILLLLTPTMYRSFKDFYWTRQLKKLSTEEIISDRYEWLRLSMIRDEVEAGLLSQVPAGGFKPTELGPSTPP